MKLADLLTTDAVSDARFSALELAGISTDSRTVKPGDLFVAVAGAKDDGLRFVGGALASGAAAIMAERAPPMALPDGVAFIKVGDARRALALGAAKFFPRQPEVIAAITGTSGKTSVAAFTRQIWAALGKQAASIGTVGLVSPTREVYGSLTTPDPVALHRSLDELAGEGVTHLAMEASSHGLDQRRLDGVRVAAGAFTNLSRDHLDYHPTLEDYLAAKLRLFTDLIVPGGAAVIAADHEHADAVSAAAKRAAAAHSSPSAGAATASASSRPAPKVLRRCSSSRMPASDYTVRLPLPGAFQVENALVAAGLALRDRQRAGRHVSRRWRISKAPRAGSNWSARTTARRSSSTMRTSPMRSRRRSRRCGPTPTQRLVVVFGCGGDRDAGKRPMMGAIAAAHGRPGRRHRRQPAQRESGGDPRRDTAGVARRDRDRRPARGDRGVDCGPAPRRCAADRGQGP